MAQVIYARRALKDLERLADFLSAEAPHAAIDSVDTVIDAIKILERHPLVGRICENELRELVISYGKRGYVALYSYEAAVDVALILAIRHQQEAGYAGR